MLKECRGGSRELTERCDPWPDGNVGNGEVIANEEPRRVVLKSFVHDTVETARLIDVTLQRVGIVTKRRHLRTVS